MFDIFTLFANPANIVVGGALISSPILIHLINRMRFKRVRWAAMEFLLKSQKRNRRRLIIEQMILLLLRILMVLLTALLLARFLGASLTAIAPQNTLHVVLLDDRLSMTDQWKGDGQTKKQDSFQAAKQIIETEIAKNALLNRSTQRLVVRRLSNPTRDIFDKRLTDQSLAELHTRLASEECSYLHLDMLKGVQAAHELFSRNPTDQGVLYVVSDFRQAHWFEPEATDLIKELGSMPQANIKVNLVDMAHPKRSDNQKMPLYHDNLSIVDLRPETRVVAQNALVQFRVAVVNYGVSERKNVRITVKVDGKERSEASVMLTNVPPGKTPVEGTFLLSFDLKAGDKRGFRQVTANIENDNFGLQADNTRYAVIEVLKQVRILVIDGDLNSGDQPGGDSFHLRTLFNAAQGFEITRGGVAELERLNLDQFASIYILNVRELTSEKQLKNLESFVREGGGIAFFLGDQVTNTDYYNKTLYADGKGLFPAPLAAQPSRELNEDEKRDKTFQYLVEPQPQMFVRNPKHPMLEELYKTRDGLKYLSINRYFPVRSRPNHVEELLTLPNDRSIADYESAARDLLKELPIGQPRYEKYRPGLELNQQNIQKKLAGNSLSALGGAFETLLQDPGEANNPDRPSMKEFWEQNDSAIIKLRDRIDKFRTTVQMGDPLVLARSFGKGRSIAVLTSAGRKWNDWAAGSPGSFTFPLFMLEMQKYLSSLSTEANLNVGAKKFFEKDGVRYAAEMLWDQADAQGLEPATKKNHLNGKETQGRLVFEFDQAMTPGVYFFELTTRPGEGGGLPHKETFAYAFNVDTEHESNLRRADKSELEKIGADKSGDKKSAIKVLVPGGGLASAISDHKSDLSESAWLYLLFLVVLIAEQALAVHLSFHLRGNEAAPPPAVRPQATAA